MNLLSMLILMLIHVLKIYTFLCILYKSYFLLKILIFTYLPTYFFTFLVGKFSCLSQ